LGSGKYFAVSREWSKLQIQPDLQMETSYDSYYFLCDIYNQDPRIYHRCIQLSHPWVSFASLKQSGKKEMPAMLQLKRKQLLSFFHLY
jgi:hypothetical protein